MISIKIFWITTVLLGLLHPQPDFRQISTQSGDQDSISKYLYVNSKAIWPEGSRKIHVCWENPQNASEANLAEVQTAVTESWQKYSAVVFIWTRKCELKSDGLRIFVEDSSKLGPHTSCVPRNPDQCLGYFLNGLHSGIVFNFTYLNWSPSCQKIASYCNKAIAVHEFGHALGFAHEQNRPDAPGECQRQAQGTPGDLGLTPYDKHSVMNYCNEKWNNGGQLSELDKQALNKVYSIP